MRCLVALFAALQLILGAGCATKQSAPEAAPVSSDLAMRQSTSYAMHGVQVADPYQWLEDAHSEAVQSWTAQRNLAFDAYTDSLSQRQKLYDRFQHLWRYDDESTPQVCQLSERIIFHTKQADQDKWVVHMREREGGEGRVIIDPNTWEETETLAGFTASPDCRYAAFGKARAGDENPIIKVLDLDTLEVLPDSLRGWRQGGVDWLHDNSGFYYSSKPLEGEVAEGEHHYWHRGWFHTLGTPASQDVIVAQDTEVKETWNGTSVSEDGRWLLVWRSLFNKTELWLEAVGSNERKPLVTGMEDQYGAVIIDDIVYIHTDWQAPNYRVMSTAVDKLEREHWVEFIAQSDDRLSSLLPIDGRFFAHYLHNAATRIDIYSQSGERLGEVPLPTVGSASIWGYWSKAGAWLSFSSFAHPSSVYTWDAASNSLTLYKESPIDIDPSGIVVDQVWYPSRDGTQVSMFVIHHEDARKDGSVPFLLSGYGGFNVSMTPRFSTVKAVWIESGGGIAIPNLRGGGEYGRAWHEAGMKERKQNVFDDFIAAAEWLEAEGWTSRDRLAISGGSNGGLLVSAAVTQRPELFAAVLCEVPLTDMVRFHKLGLANIWTEEYGSADDAQMFPHIHAYSPYHNTGPADYPAILVTGSENDARTDPAHARKFAAAVRFADEDHGSEEPILLHIQGDSGHGGAVTIDQNADQYSRHYAFLMAQIGMTVWSPAKAEPAAEVEQAQADD
jgi:prolyl oligopeptidase